MIGQTVSHYRIIEKLGGGGMGVVYQAEDTKLRRSVAIKFLPPELTRDEEAKQRFIQEAQAASALDHPNICTIHEIDETADGQLFLVMTLYEGETLQQRIERGPLKIDEALDYAIQIGQGLVKAHASGIVHRDIKPANLLVTRDGLIKIVDFGVAKLMGQTGMTRTGTTLGTVAYMSPEQTTGQAVDHRADIWSLGVVLYEMVAGELPFKGENAFAVANAIVQTVAAPLTSVRTGVSKELERIVARALAKHPDDRYQTAADLVSELRRIKRESDRQLPTVVGATRLAPAAARSRRLVMGVLAALVVSILAIAGYLLVARRDSRPAGAVLTNPQRLVATVALEDYPSWSSDGRMVAYSSNQGGNLDIWVMQIGSSAALNRTSDYAGEDGVPQISPDGGQIAFWSLRDGGGIFVMPTLGGAARKIAALGPSFFTGSAWSPDGTELAYPIGEGAQVFMERRVLRTGETRRTALPGRVGNRRLDLMWSPDGRFVAYVDARNQSAQITDLWILRLADGKGIRISDGRMNEWAPTWSPDSRAVYFASNRGGAMDIWRQLLSVDGEPSGSAERLTTGLDVTRASLSPDGRKIAYVKGRPVGNVWRVPIRFDRPATWTDATQLTFDHAHIEFMDVSTDGRQLVVSSDRAGNPDLWIMPAEGGEMHPFASDPTPEWGPAWSRDGKQIAFYAYRSGNREIWVQPVDGGPARQLTRTEAESVAPRWSPDGRTIIFSSRRGTGVNDIWTVDASGGDARPFLVHPAVDERPDWSPDGQSIAFVSRREGRLRIWRVAAAGGEPAPLTKGPGLVPRWSRDGRWVFHLALNALGTALSDVAAVSADGKIERRMTDLSARRGRMGPDVLAADDRYLYFGWREDVADIWTMDLVAAPR